ncbi:mannosyltransferase family protein [Actinoallomurus soli]|uniref:mannosyltransferase family protein n=1 Tax=Actinoallomurus soli TaxID=2952535 RepID=UPI002093A4BD|nr:mannosyltransferase family protein [Actinoallomurus soli]MCO5970168.1 hypothetical protein [Actinoallomurus soli]
MATEDHSDGVGAERLRPGDRLALGAWFGTRAAVLAISLLASALWSYGDLHDSFLNRWTQWDVDHFVEIARYGYRGDPSHPPDPGLPAFFPGLPLALRILHPLIPNWQLSALLVSLVAGAVAMVALARLGDEPAGTAPGAHASHPRLGAHGITGAVGPRAVLALLVSPYAVFLFAGYSESLFLAFALPAWLLARQRRWEAAALCAAGASCVRVTGLFLAVALIVEFLTADRRWRSAPWLAVPFLPVLGYILYLWRRTGDWSAWQHAQEAGWGRSTVWPWKSFETTWHAAFGTHDQFTTAFRVELIAAAVGVVLTCWLLWRRQWAESVYVGLPLLSLLTSAYYLSIGRATLLWWPLWLAIGRSRRPAYLFLLALFIPLMVAEVVTYNSGGWAG